MILALVTSAETAPPLATALTTVGDCAYDGRHTKNGRVERCKSGKVVEAAADGHEKEI